MLQRKYRKAGELQFKNDFLLKFPLKKVKNAPQATKVTIQSNKLKSNSGLAHPQYTELGILLRKITGQCGKLIKARKSVASFQLMKGDIIGILTTLRGHKMDSFLEKLLFMVHVGEGSNLLSFGRPYYHSFGMVQFGTPIYFQNIKFENKEKFG